MSDDIHMNLCEEVESHVEENSNQSAELESEENNNENTECIEPPSVSFSEWIFDTFAMNKIRNDRSIGQLQPTMTHPLECRECCSRLCTTLPYNRHSDFSRARFDENGYVDGMEIVTICCICSNIDRYCNMCKRLVVDDEEHVVPPTGGLSPHVTGDNTTIYNIPIANSELEIPGILRLLPEATDESHAIVHMNQNAE